MSTKTEPNSAVTAYLDAVRLYLSDLPDWDVEDLMADIEQHVIEVASEWDGPITSVLGDPISFVEEYRLSADVPSVSVGPSTPPLIDRVVHTVENLRKGHLWLSVRAFAREARPGWWGLRGYMAASIVMFIFSSTTRTTMVDPFVFGPLGLLVSVVGVVLSIHLGRRSQRPSWRRWVAIALNVVVLAALIISGQQVNDASYYQLYSGGAIEDLGYQVDSAYEAGFHEGRTAVGVLPEVAQLAPATMVEPQAAPGSQAELELAIGEFQSCIAERGATVSARFVPAVGVEIDGAVDTLNMVGALDDCLEQTNLRAFEVAYLDSIGATDFEG